MFVTFLSAFRSPRYSGAMLWGKQSFNLLRWLIVISRGDKEKILAII